jgi:hypothetical protein
VSASRQGARQVSELASARLYRALEMTDEGSSGSRLASENDVADLRPRQLLPYDMKAPLGHPR